MTENEAKTVLKVVLADQKKINAFLKKMFAYVPKDSTALEADHLAKKLDKLSLDVLYVCDVIIKINVRYVIINRFLRYIQ